MYKAFLQIDTPILGASRVICVPSLFFQFYDIFVPYTMSRNKFRARSCFNIPTEQPKDPRATVTKFIIMIRLLFM